MQQASER